MRPDSAKAEPRGDDHIASDLYIGWTLDEKYAVERLLGRGGMGAVYLATHLGTQRYVALKVIMPELMRNHEFVERFKREARAAGRLRHPNIVDVTDFGFANVEGQRIAYLVMEYLDGCTLRQVLTEEKRLPPSAVVEVLEQVCSALEEAHKQGIVHRDLKPDNIWLEPNRLGGYRAKVLDFGIAKLTGKSSAEPLAIDAHRQSEASVRRQTAATVAEALPVSGISPGRWIDPLKTPLSEEVTVVTPARDDVPVTRPASTDRFELTCAGALLGTPSYMSPEQCRGEHSDIRSDIYALGVIAYEMLSGTPPHTGDMASVMAAHIAATPKPLHKAQRRIPKTISAVVMSALEKDPLKRPESALAFANTLRANADGVGVLYRRAIALYSEYFPHFLKLSLLGHIPLILVAAISIIVLLANPQLSPPNLRALEYGLILLNIVATFITGSTMAGLAAIMVTRLTLAPLRKVEVGTTLALLRRRWWSFAKTALLAGVRVAAGLAFFLAPGVIMLIRYFLWAPVVLMEGVEKKAALKRSTQLTRRSWRAMLIAIIVQTLLPKFLERAIHILLGVDPTKTDTKMQVLSQLAALNSIFILPLLSIVTGLLYLKMRQLGGETLAGILQQLEGDEPSKAWERQMAVRLLESRS